MGFRFPDRWSEGPGGSLGLNPLAQAVEARKAVGKAILDLTVSNPTKCNLVFPEGWETMLGGRAVRSYDPDPRGSAAARAAIAAYYDARDRAEGLAGRSSVPMDPEDLFLTAGTSEGYSHLFKLLCEPGGHALIPRPSYPLLETLAGLEGVNLGTYDLLPEAGWKIDRAGLEAALTTKTRIVFVVHPNNPTGSLLSDDDAEWLLQLAERRSLAVVVDEVFADFTHPDENGARPLAAPRFRSKGPLVFTLNGLSKLLGLPQLKLAWIHVDGNEADKEKAKNHLEWICDAYLSVGAAPQAACAALLQRREEFQGPLRERLRVNLAAMREIASEHPRMAPLWPQGGWCIPIRCVGIVEAGLDDEAFAIRLVEREGVLVQPGYFFDFDDEEIVIVSLLPEPETFREGILRIASTLTASA